MFLFGHKCSSLKIEKTKPRYAKIGGGKKHRAKWRLVYDICVRCETHFNDHKVAKHKTSNQLDQRWRAPSYNVS